MKYCFLLIPIAYINNKMNQFFRSITITINIFVRSAIFYNVLDVRRMFFSKQFYPNGNRWITVTKIIKYWSSVHMISIVRNWHYILIYWNNDRIILATWPFHNLIFAAQNFFILIFLFIYYSLSTNHIRIHVYCARYGRFIFVNVVHVKWNAY